MLYEILKVSKLGAVAAPDMFTGLLAAQMPFAKGGGEIAELSGVPPLSFRANGKPLIDWKISGNTVQNGTPTPSNPVEVNGVGVRTENLVDYNTFANDYWVDISSGLPVPYGGSGGRRTATLTPIDVSALSEVTFNYSCLVSSTLFIYSLFNGNTLVTRVAGNSENSVIDVTGGDKLYLCFYSSRGLDITTPDVSNAMLNSGSTALPYEPYGYKIPVTCGGATTDIYIGGSPLYDGDTISMADTGIVIPTVYGNNVLTVDTTVQPSEVYIKYQK